MERGVNVFIDSFKFFLEHITSNALHSHGIPTTFILHSNKKRSSRNILIPAIDDMPHQVGAGMP